MESLAVVIAFLFLIALFAGPFAIGISSPRLKDALAKQEGVIWLLIKINRKLTHFIAITLGFIVGTQLISLAVTAGKLIGLWAVVSSYIALRREYFPEFYLLRTLFNRMGFKTREEPPIFSADGTEIIRAKKTKRFGRSSGRDGHGPAGQH